MKSCRVRILSNGLYSISQSSRPLPCLQNSIRTRTRLTNFPRTLSFRKNYALNRLRSPLCASYTPYLLVLVLALGSAIFYEHIQDGSTEESIEDAPILIEKDLPEDPSSPKVPSFSDMPVPPGSLGSLTPDQEAKLRELWAATLKTFGVDDPHQSNGAAAGPEAADAASEVDDSTGKTGDKKKKRMSIFRKHDRDSKSDHGTTTPTKDPSKSSDSEDKYGQMKEFQEILATQSPESLRSTFWSMVKGDHPDALLLRFLRARKWDVDRALVMMISTMKWRAEMRVDDDVVKHGEGGALEDSKSSSSAVKKDGDDFLAQLRMGKSFLHGVDKEGRPLCVVRARLHKSGDQSEKSLERYTVYVIETGRLMLKTPVETSCIVFDMTHFTMANMDYTPVKFMIKVFEANYPESLGVVLVHKAPWIFNTIWTIIKGWLDPVVASKVHFTKNAEDLEIYIPKSHIIKELGGEMDWEYHYVEPQPGENDMMKEEAPRITLEEERSVDVAEFQKKTFDWLHMPTTGGVRQGRDALAERLNHNYWALDPYIRARTLYDRQGIIEKGGQINFYPPKKQHTPAAVNGGVAYADDVD